MFLSPRHAEIVQMAKDHGRVLVDDLAIHFDVTPQTIRKDLNDLCEQRVLRRIHGGALFPSGIENVEYESRRMIAAQEKEAIGKAAARLIPDGASLFINIGTTTEEVSRALLKPGRNDPPQLQPRNAAHHLPAEKLCIKRCQLVGNAMTEGFVLKVIKLALSDCLFKRIGERCLQHWVYPGSLKHIEHGSSLKYLILIGFLSS